MSHLLSTYLLLSQNIRNHENFLWIHGTFLVDNRNTFGLNSRLVELVDNVTTVVRYGQIMFHFFIPRHNPHSFKFIHSLNLQKS